MKEIKFSDVVNKYRTENAGVADERINTWIRSALTMNMKDSVLVGTIECLVVVSEVRK